MATFLALGDRICLLMPICRLLPLLKLLGTLPSCDLTLLQALAMGLCRACLGCRRPLMVSEGPQHGPDMLASIIVRADAPKFVALALSLYNRGKLGTHDMPRPLAVGTVLPSPVD